MSLYIKVGDITKSECDVIVNAANKTLEGGGGVDGAIHKAAGPKLLEECRSLGGCEVGEAKLTDGYDLPAKSVIHTVGPKYIDGKHDEKALLKACYIHSLELAESIHADSIEFPLISSGAYGYPRKEALDIAISSIKEYLTDSDINVGIVLFDNFLLDECIDIIYKHQVYVENVRMLRSVSDRPQPKKLPDISRSRVFQSNQKTFTSKLTHYLNKCGYENVDVYQRVGLNRNLFLKIVAGENNYIPRKFTLLSLCIAMELSIQDTTDLLMSAGYSFPTLERSDSIIYNFIYNKNYDIHEINKKLNDRHLPLISTNC